MNILQCGVPKSGNFWLYKIIQQILTRTGHSTTSFIERQPIYTLAKTWELNFPEQARIDVLDVTDLQYSYRISSIFRMPVDDIRDYVGRSPHVWCHSPVCSKSDELLTLFDKKVYIIRDPRDMAVSAARYCCSGYMLKYFPQQEKDPRSFLNKNFDRLMHEWVWHVYDYLRLSRRYDIHIVFYEEFLMNFQQELGRLLSYLGIDLDPGVSVSLEEAVTFQKLKKNNPKHLKKGKSGYWKEQLTDEQVESARVIAGPLIRYLNYPDSKGQPVNAARYIGLNGWKSLRQSILRSQEQLYVD